MLEFHVFIPPMEIMQVMLKSTVIFAAIVIPVEVIRYIIQSFNQGIEE